jgi:hypothetical protein
MSYKSLDLVGRIPVVLFYTILVRATDTPATPGILAIAVFLLVAQFAAIARCLYLGKPEASK